MKITKTVISNYRNLDGMSLIFDPKCNFIVGENNTGKSNLLTLLETIFTNKFRPDDFSDMSKPIEIEFGLKLSEVELGHFEDLFDSEDYHNINILCRQLTEDDYIEFYHKETNTYIQPAAIRGINYICYDSIRNPAKEIGFSKRSEVGKFLTKIISRYLLQKGLADDDFVNADKMTDLIADINSKIIRIRACKDFNIKASLEDTPNDLLPRMIVFKDANGNELFKSGHGIQCLILITLSILERIENIVTKKKNQAIFEHDNKKHISLVLGLDEPEIHLHPYMQRSLVKYLNDIISNKNQEFQELVKELFGIDEFDGQIIIATHSPNIILNAYRQIIRLYFCGEKVEAKCGNEITLGGQHTKHLHLQFPFIKEAFFSRCVIFVEGESELGSLESFAKNLNEDLDELGIGVIKSGGKGAIEPLIHLAEQFGIAALGIKDKDKELSSSEHPMYYTDRKDFEEELVVKLIGEDQECILRNIVKDFDSEGERKRLTAKSLNKWAVKKYEIKGSEYTSSLKLKDIKLKDKEDLKAYYITWLSKNKSLLLGKLIGERLGSDNIPEIYKKVIAKAVELAK